MRTIQFKMERQGLVTEGQEVEITDHEADSGKLLHHRTCSCHVRLL